MGKGGLVVGESGEKGLEVGKEKRGDGNVKMEELGEEDEWVERWLC